MLKAKKKNICFLLVVALLLSCSGVTALAAGDSVPFSEQAELSVKGKVNLSEEHKAALEANPDLKKPKCSYSLVWNGDDPYSAYSEKASFPIPLGTLLDKNVRLRVSPPDGYFISKLVISENAEKTLPTIAEKGTFDVSLSFSKFLSKDKSGWNSSYITDSGDLTLSLVCDPIPNGGDSVRIRYKNGKLSDLGFSDQEVYISVAEGLVIPYPSDAEFSTAAANGYTFNGYTVKFGNGASMDAESSEYVFPYMNATVTTQWKESSNSASETAIIPEQGVDPGYSSDNSAAALQTKRDQAQQLLSSGDYQGVLDLIGSNPEGDPTLADYLAYAQAALNQAAEQAAAAALQAKRDQAQQLISNGDYQGVLDLIGSNPEGDPTLADYLAYAQAALNQAAEQAAAAAAMQAKRDQAQQLLNNGDYQGVVDLIGSNPDGDQALADYLAYAQDALKQAAEQAAAATLQEKRDQARQLLSNGDFQGVVELIGSNPDGDQTLADYLAYAQDALKQAAEQAATEAALQAKRDQARQLLNNGDYQGVVDLIGSNPDGDQTLADYLAYAQDALKKAAEQAAAAALQAKRDQAQQLISNGDYQGVIDLIGSNPDGDQALADYLAYAQDALKKAAEQAAAAAALQAKRDQAQQLLDRGDYQGVVDLIGSNSEGDTTLANYLARAQAALKQAADEAAKKAAEEKAAQEEAAKKAAEEKAAQEEAAKKAAEEKASKDEAARKAAEEKASQEEAARRAAEQKAAEEEAARKSAEEEAERAAAARKEAEEEAARKRAEEEAARKRAEEAEAARQAAVDEAARKAAEKEAEAARKAAEEAEAARRAAEEEAARKAAAEEAARKAAEEAASAQKAAEEEAARKQAEEEAAKKARSYRLIVNPRSQTWTYDGLSHSLVEYDFNGLADGDRIVRVSFKPTSVITNVGTVSNEIQSVEITDKNGGDVPQDKYIVTSTPGTLTVTPRDLTVTAISGSLTVESGKSIVASTLKSPDGTFNAGYKAEGLLSGHQLSGNFVTGSGTSSFQTGIDLGQLRILDYNNNDVTRNYNIRPVSGYININTTTVTQRSSVPLTVTAKSGTFQYDGNAHTVNEYNVSGLIDGDVIDKVIFKSTSSITDVGTQANEIQSVVIKSANGAAVDNSKYNISFYSGALTVTKFPLTLTAVSDEKIYDGKALNNKNVKASALANAGHSLSADYEIYDSNGNTIKNGPVDPGVYTKKINNVKITSGTQDVTSNYDIKTVDGTLKITGTVSGSAVNKGTTSIAYYGNPFTIRSDAPYSEFQYLLLDGQRVSPEQYTVREGSTIITLKASFIQSLKTGSHNYTIVSSNSKTDGSFTVAKSPKTADGIGILLWIILLLAAAIAVAAAFFFLKRAGKLGGKKPTPPKRPATPAAARKQTQPVDPPVRRKPVVPENSPSRKQPEAMKAAPKRPVSVVDLEFDPRPKEEEADPTGEFMKGFSLNPDEFRTPVIPNGNMSDPTAFRAASEAGKPAEVNQPVTVMPVTESSELPDLEVEIVDMGDTPASELQDSSLPGMDSPAAENRASADEFPAEPDLPRGRHEAPAPGEAPVKQDLKVAEPSVAEIIPDSGDSVQDAIDWINAMLNRSDEDPSGRK